MKLPKDLPKGSRSDCRQRFNSPYRIGENRKNPPAEGYFFYGFIPEEVFKEVTEAGKNKPGSDVIRNAEWVETKAVQDRTQVNLLMASLDEGEAEVLALSK